MRKFISIFLIMAMLVGIVGTSPITAAANEGEVPARVFTIAELAEITASQKVTAEDIEGKGVKVTYDNPASAWARVGTFGYQLDKNGVHIEVTDIECNKDDYSFVMYLGNQSRALYDQKGYMLYYENSGKFSIIATRPKTAGSSVVPTDHPTLVDGVQLDPLEGNLSIDIKLVNRKYVITVNGNSYSIPARYADSSYAIGTTNELRFSFAILDPISDGAYTSTAYPDATYTIKSIKYNVGVTLDSSSKTMLVGEEKQLSAGVLSDSVSEDVTWQSSDESIATVNAEGNVTAISEGTVSITATLKEDPTKSAACEVKVCSPLALSAVSPQGNGAYIAKESVPTGVKVTTTTSAAKYCRVFTPTKVSLETGVNIEIGDIIANEEDANYSIVVAIGKNDKQWYDKTGYLLICGASGSIAIVKAPISGTGPISVNAIASGNIGNLGDGLSISIEKEEADYIITVNGTELTIANGADVLNAACCLSFGIMSDIAIEGATVNNLNYVGPFSDLTGNVSFVIKSIEYQQPMKSISYKSTFGTFRSETEKKAPIAPEGYVFAGWYSDVACQADPVSSNKETLGEGEDVYARFVPEEVLRVEAQARYNETDTNKIDLRFVTTVDSYNYKSVGFEVTDRADVTHKYLQQFVFVSLQGAGIKYEPTYFNQLSIRFATINMIGLTFSGEGISSDREIPVRAYWITKDGTTVYGPARTVKISDAVNAIPENAK